MNLSTLKMTCQYPECSYETEWDFALLAHWKRHHGKIALENIGCSAEIDSYYCSVCSFISQLRIRLVQHLKGNHRNFEAPSTESFREAVVIKRENCDFRPEIPELDEEHVCPYCGILSFSRIFLYKHVEDCQNLVVGKTNFEWFECRLCSYKAKQERDLKRHEICNHGFGDESKWLEWPLSETMQEVDKIDQRKNTSKWFKCAECSYKTIYNINMKRHQISKHAPIENIDWLKCSDCPYKTKQKGNLKRHQMSSHVSKDQINWLECTNCSYRTKQKGNLKRHQINSHLSDDSINWLECALCAFRAKNKSTMAKHRLKEHANRDETTWLECGRCRYKTVYKRDMKSHQIIEHNANVDVEVSNVKVKWSKCGDCSYKTQREGNLRRHQILCHLSRDEIKWLECAQCSFKTKSKEYLEEHQIRKHTLKDEMRWFTCQDCSYKTVLKRDMKSHQILRHTAKNEHE